MNILRSMFKIVIIQLIRMDMYAARTYNVTVKSQE